MARKEQHVFSSYLRKLTNLSGNSRSIYLPRASSEQFIDLHTLGHLNGEKSFSIIEALIAGKSKVLCPLIDTRMEASNEASKRIKRLQRLDQLIFEERGSKDLHIGWPFARGKFMDGTRARAPLLFFPVVIKLESNNWAIHLRKDADVTFNKSFLLAYSFYNQVRVEDFLLDETFEERDTDSTVFRTALYQLLQKSSVDIHFNPDNYRDELDFFKPFTQPEFDEAHANGSFKLFPEAVLGIFPQAGSYLVPDYVELIEGGHVGSLEGFFMGKNQAEQQSLLFPNFIQLVNEEKLFTGFPMDAWQENILKASKIGYSAVVQGPPGTGKSQLICNLIADAIATGKKVLVVCQKRAALDVVYGRLKGLQLSGFLALVHDFKNDRKEIYAKGARQVERVDEYRLKNNSLDAIQLNRKFLQVCHRIDQITEELDEFKKALFNDTECGACVKELYLRSNPNETSINLKQEYQNFPIDTIGSFHTRLKSYAFYAQTFDQQDYPWRDRKPFAGLGITDLKEMEKILNEIPATLHGLFNQLETQIGAKLDWDQCEELLEHEPELNEMMAQLDSGEVYSFFQQMVEEDDNETSALWLANIERLVLSCFEEEGPESSLPTAQLGTLQQALYRRMKARRSLVGLVRWELFSKDKFLIKRALVGNGLENNRAGFKKLEAKLDRRLNLEHNLSKLKTKAWLKNVPEKINEKEIQGWFANQKKAIQAKLIFRSVRGIGNFIDLSALGRAEVGVRIKKLFQVLSSIPALKIRWNAYLGPNQIALLTQHPEKSETLKACLLNDFDALCEFDNIREGLTPDERASISKLQEAHPDWQPDAIQKTFINSLCLAWIDHIETKFPVLRIVSSGKLTLLESELQDLVVEKQKLGNEIILLRARERVADDLEFNRLNNRVTYRDLHHQLTKKKRIWPVRKLISEFESEIFRLLPCWLASPESVSAIFPLKEMFDLVVFDEASQCFAERGIPAMYRGKQAIVAGDDKQLKPSDLYRIRWQDGEEDNPDLEVDSLLELSARYLMQLPLLSHYRSKSLELIDFSNRYFYDGKLTLLPDAGNINPAEPPVAYHKVDGIWENNTNKIEADAIVSLVLGMVKSNPEKEIGIVCFNAPQQMLILDLLDEAFSKQQIAMPGSLIVKNIENVQGDEKDIIVFSIGYAPDLKGKMHFHFGSLSMAGGENRLNVAITRAREKVMVVTSIFPEQLQVDETKNDGPKLLKKYLQYIQETANGHFKPFIGGQNNTKANWYLKDIIGAWGIEKFPDKQFMKDVLPFADVSAHMENDKVGLILTDDELYRQNPSVKDLHASMMALFEQKKWRALRAYSRNYWQDHEKFFNEVAKFVAS